MKRKGKNNFHNISVIKFFEHNVTSCITTELKEYDLNHINNVILTFCNFPANPEIQHGI